MPSPWFDQTYYQEHKDLGLDYLNHGTWQLDHAKWVAKTFGLDRGSTILDLGCACGSITEAIRLTTGGTVVGIDPSEFMINLGKATFKELILAVGCGMDLRMFKDETFDFIYSMQVFEHLLEHHVPSVLSEMSRVLKPEGQAFVALDLDKGSCIQEILPDTTHTCVRRKIWWLKKFLDHRFDVAPYVQCPWDHFVLRRSHD